MPQLNQLVLEYQQGLQTGRMQEAYRGIMDFMSGLRRSLEKQHPQWVSSGLYPGYLDMTYFAFTPPELVARKLKIAVVYLHEANRFELWLGAVNRRVQAETIERLRHRMDTGYLLSQAGPGVDSILVYRLQDAPEFDDLPGLMDVIGAMTVKFTRDVLELLEERNRGSLAG